MTCKLTWLERINLEAWLGSQPAGNWAQYEPVKDARVALFPKAARDRFMEDFPDGRSAYRLDEVKDAPPESFELEKAEVKRIREIFDAWSPTQCVAFDLIQPIVEKLKTPTPAEK